MVTSGSFDALLILQAGQVLGKGGEGRVMCGLFRGEPVAVKVAHKADTNELQWEAQLLSRVSHPCIQRLYGLTVDADDKVTGLVTEQLHDGNVREALIKRSFGASVSPTA
jgi:serine/threonine protein kinase